MVVETSPKISTYRMDRVFREPKKKLGNKKIIDFYQSLCLTRPIETFEELRFFIL